ncbi:Hypothetical protein SLIV_35260 [Streptomyces lividans TK24]|uniref:Transposase n=1 Tax=Streptomyces lividans TK24 TaxID=457428 RepID=A0ABX6TQ41_STRLI|nr:Hypothetical protein SLIV_35260 [Streptomyces lividans TK24]QSJ13544.1 Hypothetical protein SLIVDG2_35260 [Streptomyces lividans]QTD74454.1 Hypothetical protein SLIVYQS_35260 [Streptomyces lividans TK24] [Streptomyces lividans]
MKMIEKGSKSAETIIRRRFPGTRERWMRAGREP